jgi:glutamate-ammonia-ligase adenylyltransferase
MRTAAGELFDIDTRCARTATGPARHLDDLVRELPDRPRQQHGWTWEHQALTRARWCAGIERAAARFEAVRRTVLAAPRDLPRLLDEVRAMREKVPAAHAVKKGCFDVKHSPAG